MEQETLRTRLMHLQQKSRKAVRLYSSVGRAEQREYAELQVAEWREANAELHREIVQVLEERTHRGIVNKLFAVRDRFYDDWRKAEATIHGKQAELIESAERADFIRAAQVARALISYKAREQASQAAHAEVQELITKSRLVQPTVTSSATIELSAQDQVAPSSAVLGDAQEQDGIGSEIRRAAGDNRLRSNQAKGAVQSNNLGYGSDEVDAGGASLSMPMLAKVIPLRK